MVVPPTALDDLRSELRKRRLAATIAHRAFAPELRLQDICRSAACLGLYLPVRGEPDPFSVADFGHDAVALPAMAGRDAPMTFRRWSPGDALVASPWGGKQPSSTAPHALPDVIIVPLLGFDRRFNRIGQGGGHYDRYLAAHPDALRIGLAWGAQEVDRIDARPWDMPLDAILTETDFHIRDLNRCRSR